MAKMQGSINNSVLLQAALEGLELQRNRIDEQIQLIRAKLGIRGAGRPPKAVVAIDEEVSETSSKKATKKRKKRQLSAEARERIAEAQKRRWANFRKEKN
jgi:hypothetical protein